jgi:threonine synthase
VVKAADESRWVSRCPRCGEVTPLNDGVTGCAVCATYGIGMPLVPFRAAGSEPERPDTGTPGHGAMWRWSSHLVPVGEPVTLGEGGTPLTGLHLPGLPGRVLLKDERANPTGSFKDRLASAVVGRARHLGAETVAVASSGNAGLSVAAYAAAAGLRSVLLAAADPGLPAPAAAAATAMGSRVVLTPTFADRWAAVRTGAEELGWFPITNYTRPPVASHPSGLLAYRTIAFEIAESLTWEVPDWVILPVSRGDGLFGIWSGFVELAELGWTRSVPRMLAVERLPSLTDALTRGLEQPELVAAEGPARARSISDPQASAMAMLALRASGGDALCCDDDQLDAAWARLAGRGVLLELSSAAVLLGVDALAGRGLLHDGSTAVLVATAGPHAQQSLANQVVETVHLRSPTDAAELAALADGVHAPDRGRFEA